MFSIFISIVKGHSIRRYIHSEVYYVIYAQYKAMHDCHEEKLKYYAECSECTMDVSIIEMFILETSI